jgi:phage I-like protein
MSSTISHIALMQAQVLPAGPSGTVPDWIQLIPAGSEITTQDGRGPYRVIDPQAVVASLRQGQKLPIDENHAIDWAAPRGEPSPARGYIVELQARETGIWGRVDWTESGRALMADRAYLGISPAIVHDGAKRVIGLARASLTNKPNLRGMTALHMETDMSLIQRLATALGLDPSTGEDALVERVTSLHQSQTTATALQSSLSEIGVALGAAQDAQPEAILDAARVAASREGTVVTALQSQLTTLQTELGDMKTTRARERAEAFVDGAKADRRMGITQGNRDEFIAMHMESPERTEKLINGFAKLPEGAKPDQDTAVALQSDSRDLVTRARAYQKDHPETSWSEAVIAVSEGRK